MNLFKKATAAVALVALVSSVFTTGVSAASTSAVAAANTLAAAGYINDHSSDTAAYNLNQNVLRQEIAAVSRGIAGIEKSTEVKGTFADVTATIPNTWAVYSVEPLADAGIVSTSNENFRPEDEISKAEGLGMVVKAACSEYSYDSTSSNSWEKQVVDFAVSKGITSTFANYTTSATRGFVFEAAANAMTACSDTAETCDEVSQLLGLCETDPETDPETGTGTVTPPATGTASVILNAETPADSDVPTNVSGVEVMKFDITAGSSDLTVNSISLKRQGLGASDAVKSAVLFADNARISKAKTFNSATDLAEVNITPALNVMAGETKTITVKVATFDIGKFSVSLENVNASATVDAVNVVSNKFEVISVNTTTLNIEKDGTVTDPKLGEEQAELLKFKVENDGAADEDVELASITFKDADSNIDTDVENITLYSNGSSVAVVPSVDGKYVTFNFATPIVIREDKTEKFVIKADIISGASDTIDLFIDNELDVTVKSPKNEYATVAINANLAAIAPVSIKAGQVTIIDEDPINTDVLDNKKNVVFGTFEINATSGKDLYVDSVAYTLTDTAGQLLDADLENVELYDATNGVTYDPTTPVGANNSQVFSFTDLDLAVQDGSAIKFEIRADVKNGATVGNKITASVNVATDVVVKEAADDKVVTDKIPSSISFKNVEIVAADMKVNALVQSDTDVVSGTKGVEVFKFEVRSDNDASDLTVKELTFGLEAQDNGAANVDGTAVTNTRINAVYLYDGDTLLSSKSASDISKVTVAGTVDGQITFDGLNILIDKNSARTLTVKLDILDDVNNAADRIVVGLFGYVVEDSESDNVYLAVDANSNGDLTDEPAIVVSDRRVTIEGFGELNLVVDNSDTETDSDKNVLAGTTSDFIASYEFTAINEGVTLIDLEFNETSGANLKDAVSEVVLYENDKVTEIARQMVTSDTVKFNNVNYTVEEGSSNLYVKVSTHKIGKDEAGSQTADLELKLTVTDAEGADSTKTVVLPAQTAASNKFSVIPVAISNIAFVDSANGVNVESKLTNGENVVAIIAITTDSSTNTDSVSGTTLKTLLKTFKFDVTSDATIAANSIVVERLAGPGADDLYETDHAAADGTAQVTTVTLNTATAVNNEIENGDTAYYSVKATVADLTDATQKYAQVKLTGLDAASIEYASNEAGAANVSALRLSFSELTAAKVSQ